MVSSQNRKETECSECGRFIGSWEVCPFCRHFNPKRLSVRIIKYTMPFLTILGLILLGFLGRLYGIQDAKISELGRRTNFAQVRIQGRIHNEVRIHSSDDDARGDSSSVEFEVDDGTGIIRIRCYDDTTQELQEAGLIPAKGDEVSLVGNYQFKARRQFVILGSASDLTILSPGEKPWEDENGRP